jgi:hypothetical protein
MMKTYKCTFEEIFQSKKNVIISISYYQSVIYEFSFACFRAYEVLNGYSVFSANRKYNLSE